MLRPFRNHGIYDRPAYTPYRRKREPYPAFICGKHPLALVYVRRQYLYAHLSRFIYILRDFSGVVLHGSHEGSHKLRGVIVFKIRRPVGHNSICRGMGLVEGVFCEIRHLVVDLVRNSFRYPVRNAAFNAFFLVSVDEILALALHYGSFFLGHGTADKVAPAVAVARKVAHYLHYLLLVYNTPVRRRKYMFKLGTVVNNAGPVVLALDVLWNKIHRARAVQRDTRYNILYGFGFQLLQSGCCQCR